MTVRSILKVFAHFGKTAAVTALVMGMIVTIVFTPIFSSAQTADKDKTRSSSNELANSSASDKKFLHDLETIFGAAVKTKHGEMTIRQRKDQSGRVRKQIITGKDFSEIQLDQDGDGTVDFFEVTRGVKTVTVSHPNRGRFLRLEIAEKTTKGLHESLYLLNLDGRAYNFVRSRIVANDVVKRASDASVESSFEPTDATNTAPPQTLAVQSVPSSSEIASRSIGLSPNEEEKGWLDQQERSLGADYLCSAEQSGIAALQRDWWKLLKYEVKDQKEVLVDKLKNSTMFAENCKTPGRKKDFDALVGDLATVMLSSSVGQPLPTEKTRGRFLRCLELSGLGPVAARIEETFMRSLKPGISPSPIRCDWKPGVTGIATPMEVVENGQVSVHICSADISDKTNNGDGARNNYRNLLLHEFMHVAFRDSNLKLNDEEALASSAQACCGDPSSDRPKACQKLDEIVISGMRLKEIETHLLRVQDGITPLQTELRNMFSPESERVLYKNFLMGLDKSESWILSNQEYAKCVEKKSETECRAEWTSGVRAYAEIFFGKQCRQLVVGSERSQCARVSNSFKDSLAKAIASSMCSKAGKPAMCEAVTLQPREASGLFANITDLIFGRNVQAAIDPNCGCDIDISNPISSAPSTPVVTAPPGESPPSTVVSGPTPGALNPSEPPGTKGGVNLPVAGQVDRINSGNDTLSGGVGSIGGGLGRVRSPLPVTRVSSPSSGRTIAEDRYRRATDIAGALSRSALPSAIAGERENRSLRLGPDDTYVPFKADRSQNNHAKIENPFSAKRSIASLAAVSTSSPANFGSASGIENGLSPGSSSEIGGGARANGVEGEPSKGAKAFAARKRDGRAGVSPASSGLQASNLNAGSGANMPKASGVNSPQTDVLEGLFTLPYRRVEGRLKQIDVIEALIARKISIQDDKGRVHGSSRPYEKYQFTGFEKPLIKQGQR